jgi:hypothetical protein
LIEFGSVVGAVECALALQHLAADRNTAVAQDRRMEWRIGVHLGAVNSHPHQGTSSGAPDPTRAGVRRPLAENTSAHRVKAL